MRKNLVSPLIAATALVLACATAQAQDRAETLFNLVSVSAQAEREVANDTLTAVMAVDSEGSDPVALADGTNRAMRDALKLAQAYRGVKARSLNYQTWPVYDKARIVRWRVRQELRLESREFAAGHRTDRQAAVDAGCFEPRGGTFVRGAQTGRKRAHRRSARRVP